MHSTHSFTRRSAAVAALAALAAASSVSAQTTTGTRTINTASGTSGNNACYSGFASTPLAAKKFTYPSSVPYKVTTDTNICRGTQVGYNICNSTTEGQNSLCQTSFINSIDDFCLWGPREVNSLVANEEGEMVAWCTKPGRGTRLIPAGALQGVQFVKAPAYVQVVGFINQALINIASDDYGGEMDPHGADGQGNPMGGLMFSQAFGTSGSTAWSQAIEWHNFIGSGMFCLKACDPSGADAANFCQHIYDRIGCTYNAPASYDAINGTFASCASDNQLFPGVYVSGGKTLTYTQPPESLGEISTMPYTPVIPASSKCTSYTSVSLYTALATVQNSAANAAISSNMKTVTTSTATSKTTNAIAAAAAGTGATASSKPNSAGKNAASVLGALIVVGVGMLLA